MSELHKTVKTNDDTSMTLEMPIETNNYINIMMQTSENSAYRTIPKSKRKLVARFIPLVKRVIRKLMFWYVAPICLQQSAFNVAATHEVSSLGDRIGQLNHKLERIVANLTCKHEEDVANLILRQDEFFADSMQKQNESAVNVNKKLDDLMQLQYAMSEQFACKHSELQQVFQGINTQLLDAQRKLEQLALYDVFSEKHPKFEQLSTAQMGDDIILSIVFKYLGIPLQQVVYLDIGANHPIECSNTYYFYKAGAKGVLVEANPKLIPMLKLFRSGDVILNRCVAYKSGEKVDFFDLTSIGIGLSTSSPQFRDNLLTMYPEARESTIKVESISVMDLASQYFDKAPTLLSIDIEGMEEEILSSIDFKICRPTVIVCEMIPFHPQHLRTIGKKNKNIMQLMEENDYSEYAFTGVNSIFIDNQRLRVL